jgi:hypothetical protein
MNKKYIYESPDNGKTIYQREFRNYSDRKLIKNNMYNNLNESKKIYIYESPDNGKTIYRREFGDYNNRKLIKNNN